MVCTGNICRSPLAEQLLRARLRELGVPAKVRSAGSRAMAGHGMTPEAALVSRRHGGENDGHVARQLTESLIAEADLVLTATREHRSAVAALYPRAARYSFTLNQFARILAPMVASGQLSVASAADGDTGRANPTQAANGLRALVAEVAATRGFSPPPAQPADDDIEDPYRRTMGVYDRVGLVVDRAVITISRAFGSAAGRA
ncbi:low molecular weight phosphatase family protein [Cryobacterium adonitolivorans]|uniref:arsenate reductase/protein-tyrosine-phosphatase family protein n=1 Tax=Cryobacterium adonitolivorans TaxID=1259189 RepID=UPI0030BA1145